MENNGKAISPVRFNAVTCTIECSACLQKIPLSRATVRDPHRYTEEMQMAINLHADCRGTPYEAQLQRRWREVVLRQQYNGGRSADRLVWSV